MARTSSPGTLNVARCPHCRVNAPNLEREHEFKTFDSFGKNGRVWGVYVCRRCGGVTIAAGLGYGSGPNRERGRGFDIFGVWPKVAEVPAEVTDERIRAYLEQCADSVAQPAGAIMLAASAVDAMLKAKGLTQGSLYARIDQAVNDGLMTAGMGQWAHHVRLEANDQRHADVDASLPTTDQAKASVDFAWALAEILFVLPERVTRGIQQSQTQEE